MAVTRFTIASLGFSALSAIASAQEPVGPPPPKSATSAQLRGSQAAVFNSSMGALGSADSCSDTPNWANGWTNCKNEDLGWNPEYCQNGGWTCAGYVAKGWCANNQCLAHSETGVYACGQTLNYPEGNCCACGKPSPLCHSEGGACGKNNDVTADCCEGLQCQQLLGGSQMQCVRPAPECVPGGQICGGPGLQTQKCCDGYTCESSAGADKMHCLSGR